MRFERAFNTLKKIYLINKGNEGNFFTKIYTKINKLSMFIFTLLLISVLYYFYVFWFIIPFIESSQTGLDFEFYDKENWDDSIYRNGTILFIAFHFFFLLFITCFIRLIFSDPGYFDKEYNNIYSIVKFIKHIFVYFLRWRDPDFKLSVMLKEDKRSIYQDLEEIIMSIEPVLVERMSDFSNSLAYASRYNSIDVTKKNINNEAEDFNDKEKQTVSQTLTEDILESYENEFENFIKSEEIYDKFNNLQFLTKDWEHNRFCRFCLVKKPDRAHHCRQCKKCLRKMDHHCTFLYTCIGYHNYKFFFLTLFYGNILLLLMSATLLQGLKFYLNEYVSDVILTIYCILYFFLVILNTLMIYFFYMHFTLLINNRTTIDFIEKGDDLNPLMNIFDLGAFNNFRSVMGNFLTWFLPIYNDVESNGYSFEVNKENYNRMLLQKMKEKEEVKNKTIIRRNSRNNN